MKPTLTRIGAALIAIAAILYLAVGFGCAWSKARVEDVKGPASADSRNMGIDVLSDKSQTQIATSQPVISGDESQVSADARGTGVDVLSDKSQTETSATDGDAIAPEQTGLLNWTWIGSGSVGGGLLTAVVWLMFNARKNKKTQEHDRFLVERGDALAKHLYDGLMKFIQERWPREI